MWNRQVALFALTLAFTSAAPATTYAADEFNTVLTCRSARPVADAGYEIEIRTGGIAGITLATLSEITIAGARAVVETPVTRVDNSMITTFTGKDFDLTVIREILPHHGAKAGLSATLVAEVEGKRIDESLDCRFTPRKVAPPAHFGCMAYWTGFVVKDGKCQAAGASGCSNPFEFRTLEACEAASYALQ